LLAGHGLPGLTDQGEESESADPLENADPPADLSDPSAELPTDVTEPAAPIKRGPS
jgi:hypothetical protein